MATVMATVKVTMWVMMTATRLVGDEEGKGKGKGGKGICDGNEGGGRGKGQGQQGDKGGQ
jgi:hypothetical protein